MLAIVDCRLPKEAEVCLQALGHRVLRLPPHPQLDSPVASHPDMLLFLAPESIFCTKDYMEIATHELLFLSKEIEKPIVTVAGDTRAPYPYDILLNAAPVGKHLLCYPAYTAKELTNLEQYRILPVRQGYTKCSTVPVGNDALITEDSSIARTSQNAGMDVLQIPSKNVLLNGYDTGFLGGATSFAPYKNLKEILFCGDLNTHSAASQIRDFCQRHGYTVRSLGKFPLTDVGTIFLV